MAIKNPYEAYQTNSVMTASPQELTLMLYNGCLKFIRIARKAMEEKNFEEKNSNIIKAQAIIQELNITLDRKIEISENMSKLYDYLYQRLVEANIKNDVSILDEVEGFVIDFRDTWKQVMELVKK